MLPFAWCDGRRGAFLQNPYNRFLRLTSTPVSEALMSLTRPVGNVILSKFN